jgi:hypothetical protein
MSTVHLVALGLHDVKSVHRGVVLWAGRIIVIGVPTVLITGVWWTLTRRGK